MESPNLLHFFLLPVSNSWIKGLLVLMWLLLFHILVLHWPWLGLGLLFLVFSIGQFSVLVSHQVDLCGLHFPSYLLDVSSSGLGAFILLGKLAHFASWELVQVYTPYIYGFWDKVLITKEKPKYIPVQDLGCFWWVLCEIDLCLYTVVPFISTLRPLVETCQQVKPVLYNAILIERQNTTIQSN